MSLHATIDHRAIKDIKPNVYIEEEDFSDIDPWISILAKNGHADWIVAILNRSGIHADIMEHGGVAVSDVATVELFEEVVAALDLDTIHQRVRLVFGDLPVWYNTPAHGIVKLLPTDAYDSGLITMPIEGVRP